jgi:nitrogen regulatory protein PII-like uncharacterized protein
MEVAGTAVGITSFGIQVCQGLLSYYDPWKSYDSDISSTYNAISDLSKTLILLKTTLQQQVDEERVGRVRTYVNDCEDALLELDKKRHSLQKYSQPEGLRQKMRSGLQRSWYPFRKETLEALKVSVTDVHERLKLALQVLQLDIVTASQGLVLRLLSQFTTHSDSMAQITAHNQRLLDAQQSDERLAMSSAHEAKSQATRHRYETTGHLSRDAGSSDLSAALSPAPGGIVRPPSQYDVGRAPEGDQILDLADLSATNGWSSSFRGLAFANILRHVWPCYLLIASGVVVISGSLTVGLYFSVAKDRMGDGFTTAGWIIAVGTLILTAPMAIHYPHCRCWKTRRPDVILLRSSSGQV